MSVYFCVCAHVHLSFFLIRLQVTGKLNQELAFTYCPGESGCMFVNAGEFK